MEKELILRDLYYSPKTGYRSTDHLWDLAKKEDPSFTKEEVKKWLDTQHTYSKFKSYNNPRFFWETMVRHLGEQVQVDLVVLSRFSKENHGYQYILMAIEILSRFAFAVPLKKKDGATTLEGMKIFLEQFKERYHEYPKLMQFDEGKEFLNKNMEDFLDGKEITFFSVYTKRKAAVVERLNRTIKDKIAKMHDHSRNHNWVDSLQDIIENYNTQEHSSIKMKPTDVNFDNQYTVWGRLYGHIMNDIKKPKFKVGDHVRVLHFIPKVKEFLKYYNEKYPTEINPKTGKKKRQVALATKHKSPFSEEIFTIDKVKMGDPVVYKLYSEEAQLNILGIFYESELSLS